MNDMAKQENTDTKTQTGTLVMDKLVITGDALHPNPA
jgi:hypothetical protein